MSTIQFCSSFVSELLTAKHDFSSDTFMLALFPAAAGLGIDTTAYSSTNEVPNGSGYTTGGASAPVSSGYPQLSNNVAQCRFDAVNWTFSGSTLIRYALLYNSSKSNRSVLVLDFGSNISATGAFQINYPLTVDPLLNFRVPVLS